MNILGIETSCDETAVAVVSNGCRVLSNVLASQIDIHRIYGGVVPEIASRQHILQIMPMVEESLRVSGLTLREIDAIAVTRGPGLAGALLVGVNTAKAMSLALDVPLVGINHLEGHIYAAWLDRTGPDTDPGFPLLCLIASGGHTDLVLMKGHGDYNVLGRTRDDAAGEAFDKAARVLGLGFPGGPAIQRVAEKALGTEQIPRAWLRGTHDFSFSGIKTALLHKAQSAGVYPPPDIRTDEIDMVSVELAAAFQESVVDVIAKKTVRAALDYNVKGVVMGGGVTANAPLRARLQDQCDLPVLIPDTILCTDNGAMVGACGYFRLARGVDADLDWDLDPSLDFD